MIKILVVRLSSLGDIVHTYPMVCDIKQKLDDVNIDWLVDENFKQLVECNPNVDGVISIPLRKWKRSKIKFFKNFFLWYKDINKKKYDIIIDSQGLLKSSILTKCFKGIKFGFGIKTVREKIASLFYDKKIELNKSLLATTKYRMLAEKIFDYKVALNNVSFGLDMVDFLPLKDLPNCDYVIFFHASSKKNKNYPVLYWKIIAEYLINKYNYTIILPYGNDAEKKDSEFIKKYIDNKNIFIPTKIYDYLELHSFIQGSYFVIGVDTGLIHLANALNKKLIAIYTATNPENTGVIESNIAKNIGNKFVTPLAEEVLQLFENIRKV